MSSDKNIHITNYLKLNIPALFEETLPAVDPDLLIFNGLPNIEQLAEINPVPDFRRDVISTIAYIINAPEYLGRLLISSKTIGHFVTLSGDKGREVLDFESFDIKERFEKASSETKKKALKAFHNAEV